MPMLRQDLLSNLPPDDQELMKVFRRKPLRSYTARELLPANAGPIDESLMKLRLDPFVIRKLLEAKDFNGQTYYHKTDGRRKQNQS